MTLAEYPLVSIDIAIKTMTCGALLLILADVCPKGHPIPFPATIRVDLIACFGIHAGLVSKYILFARHVGMGWGEG